MFYKKKIKNPEPLILIKRNLFWSCLRFSHFIVQLQVINTNVYHGSGREG